MEKAPVLGEGHHGRPAGRDGSELFTFRDVIAEAESSEFVNIADRWNMVVQEVISNTKNTEERNFLRSLVL